LKHEEKYPHSVLMVCSFYRASGWQDKETEYSAQCRSLWFILSYWTF